MICMTNTANSVAIEKKELTRRSVAFDKRIHEIDLIRGICMILVFMDHLFWDMSHFFPVWAIKLNGTSWFLNEASRAADFYLTSPYRTLVRIIVLATFLFISGVSTAFSKSNWKRAGQMLGFYFVIQIATNLISPFWEGTFGSYCIINFNVIGVVAWSVLFYCFMQEKSWRYLAINILILALFFFIALPIIYQNVGGEDINVWPLWQSNHTEHYEADYMPLFPYIILFFLGALFAVFFYGKRVSLLKRKGAWEKPFCFIGRHSLIFYLTHQLLFVGLFSLIGLLTGWGL